jgi:acetyl-CoA carboxylase alpha subunit
LLPGDDDFPDQALRDGLTFFKGQPVQVVTQQAPKGFGMLNDLLPMPRLLLGAG